MARRPARLVAGTALLLVAAGAAAGCSSINELLQLEERIERRGYSVSSTFHDDFGAGRDEVQIEASRNRGQAPPDGTEEIAGIVWDTYPRRFDTVAVRLDDDARTFSRGDLQERFGLRAERLDEREFSDDVRSGIRGVAIGAAVAVGLGIVAIVVTIVLLRRNRRRHPPPPPPPPPPGYGTGWYPPPPPPGPPPGYGPPS